MINVILSLLEKQKGIRVEKNLPASRLTSFRIGGPISYVVYPRTIEALVSCLVSVRGAGIPFRVVGCGTNLLARDEGYPGIWFVTRDMKEIRIQKTRAEVLCGVTLRALVDTAARVGLGGMENLFGIPGTVGGALMMNAGAYGTSTGDLVENVTVFDLWREKILSFSFDDCRFGYRKSVFQEGRYVILSAEFRLTPSREDLIRATMRRLTESRAASQPLEYPNAGSIFRRPVGAFAGKLISDAGLRGYRMGDIQVSEKHCGFFVNRGSGTARDVKQLISFVQERVFDTSGVVLRPELVME